MLKNCSCNPVFLQDMKRGKIPSAEKLFTISQYLDTSIDYLMGVTYDPTPPKKELTLDEQVVAEYYKMSADEREQLKEYMQFLKIKKDWKATSINGQTDTSSELRPKL